MRKKTSQRHRSPAEKMAGPPPDKPAATPPSTANIRPVRPPRRRPWLLGLVTAALVAWLAVLIWMALSAPPAAS